MTGQKGVPYGCEVDPRLVEEIGLIPMFAWAELVSTGTK